MYNRYQGNTGHFVRVADPEPHPGRRPPNGRPTSAPTGLQRAQRRPPPGMGGGLGNLFSGIEGGLGNLLPLGNLQEKLGGILPKVLPDGLETEDLILMLVLYLMYKESGDKELLFILGAMFFL